jgi:hypothetical protein
MNRFGDQPLRNCGRSRHPDGDLDKAVFAMEHTEAMRRLDYDGVFPYMYAGWTGLRTGRQWRAEFPTPMAAALHSCMSPVLASIDLYDRNFATGREMQTPVMLINDTHDAVDATLELCVTGDDPLCVPDEDALKAAAWREVLPMKLKPQERRTITVDWTVPAKEGRYFLAAVVRRRGERPVVSQREVRALAPETLVGRLRGRKVMTLGGPRWFDAWLKRRGVEVIDPEQVMHEPDVTVVWNPRRLTDEQKKNLTPGTLAGVRSGGRLIVLQPPLWYWEDLVDFQTRGEKASRAFAYPKVKHFMLAGIEREHLMRWNGRPNEITEKRIRGPVRAKGTKLLWANDPKSTVAWSLQTGKGEVVVSLLAVKRRIERAKPTYDPVAERIVTNLLAK